jgi:glutamyl-tRNA reductase
LVGKSALIIGTGAYSRVVAAALKRIGVFDIRVFSRSGRAKAFAKSHGLVAVTELDFVQCLGEVDLVVSASGTPGTAIDLKIATEVQSIRSSELVVVDVALSKDVAPEVSDLEGVFVIDLEQLKKLVPNEHTQALIKAQEIVAVAVAEFEQDQVSRSMDPIISALRSHVKLWVEAEIESVRKKEGPEVADGVERSLNRVANAILHKPTMKAKDLAKDGNHDDYIKAVRLLFDIELGKDA